MVLPLLLALSVTASDAICAVRGWTRQGGTLTVIGAPVKADRFETAAGNAFYAVKTSEGTVFTAADTDYDPIIAFTSAVADFSEIDPASPLWALMTRSVDFACYNPDAFARWQELLAAGSIRRLLLATSQGIDSIGDVRVDPLLASKWDQGNVNGSACYNYYTPSNVVCGCVATAMAQVMYYHKYPTSSVMKRTKRCWYNSAVTNCTMKGGTYDWAAMVDNPKAGVNDAAREAIGKLTYDCGVATHMQWTSTSAGSGTYGCYVQSAFSNNFDYSSTTYTDCDDIVTAANLGKTVLSNLDAGYPVMFGISGSSGGHSIVGDGYGFNGEALYIHLNMGWSGLYNVWYKLPYLNTSSYWFDAVDEVTYNIIPGNTVKGVFSGRIVNAAGQPVANKQIRVCNASGGTLTNLTTNAYGVYGFAASAANAGKFTIRSDEDDTYQAFVSTNLSFALPSTQSIKYQELLEYTTRVVVESRNLGNSWGNELKLTAKPVQVPISTTDSGSVSIEPTWFVDYGYVSSISDSSGIQTAATQTAANGINSVAECYVIGISPTNETAQFTAEISFNPDGTVKIEHDPDLNDRTYTTKYSTDLKTWYDWTGENPAGAFFKVEVSK
jgi:hypothetical protein